MLMGKGERSFGMTFRRRAMKPSQRPAPLLQAAGATATGRDAMGGAELEAINRALGRLAAMPPCPAQIVFAQLLQYLSATVVLQPICDVFLSSTARYALVNIALNLSRPRATKAIRFLDALQHALARLAAGQGRQTIALRGRAGRLTVLGHDLVYSALADSYLITAIRKRRSRRKPRSAKRGRCP